MVYPMQKCRREQRADAVLGAQKSRSPRGGRFFCVTSTTRTSCRRQLSSMTNRQYGLPNAEMSARATSRRRAGRAQILRQENLSRYPIISGYIWNDAGAKFRISFFEYRVLGKGINHSMFERLKTFRSSVFLCPGRRGEPPCGE